MKPYADPKTRAALAAGYLWLVLLATAAAWAQEGTRLCLDGSPAQPVEQFRTIGGQTYEMWPPNFQPADPPGQDLPAARDSTGYSGFELPGRFSGLELFNDLDIVESPGGTHLFMVYNAGFQIWDIGGAFASDPRLLSQRDGWDGDFFHFEEAPTEFYFLVWDIAAVDPPGAPGDTLVAIAADGPVGFSIWDASDKTFPVQLYQNTSNTGEQVVAANIGGRSYAFFGDGGGVQVYDMTRAREVGPCDESASSDPCGGAANPVRRGNLAPWPFTKAAYLDVMTTEVGGQTRHFLAASGRTSGSYGVAIREITNAASLPPANSEVTDGLSSFSWGVDLFEIDGRYYLATVHLTQLQVYDVTPCITSEPGCDFSDLRVDLPTLEYSDIPVFSFVQFSESNGRPFLYKGHHTLCSRPPVDGGVVQEYLLDLSALPAGGQALIIRGEQYEDAAYSNPARLIDYWSSYYDGATGGYSTFGPRNGRFHGQYFYRAGHSIFDVHEWKGVTIRPSGPGEGFRDEAIAFTAIASGCSPGAVYTWTASDGGQVTGTGETVSITWGSTGTRTVTVSNSGCPQATVEPATIGIRAPEARVASVQVDPSAPVVCEQVAFTAEGVTGKTPITYDWEVRDGGGVIASGSGTTLDTFEWQTGAGTAAGNYTAEVSVSNAENPPPGDTASQAFALGAPPILTTPDPTYDGAPDNPASNTVQFRVQAPGATQWTWDWGDGSAPQTFTSRSAGENPTHTFAVREDPYMVTVTVSNCLVPGGLTSQPLSVTVNQALEVVLFRAQCSFGACDFRVGTPVVFDQQFAGGPTAYEYDWLGDGNFVSSSTPVTSHAYTAPASNFRPRIRIRRGTEQVTFTHEESLTVDPESPPSISVSGPTEQVVDQSGTYSASASNCTPAASGWTWTATGGGQVSGATSTNRVILTWSTTGTKTVEARNSACGSAVGSRTVSVTGPSVPLNADFSYQLTNPVAGAEVTFDASASTGNIVEYSWRFSDDGSRPKGVTTSHVFANAGSYQVTLEITDLPNCGSIGCLASVTKTVQVTDADRRLVLPYFEVGTGESEGLTTVFALRNASQTEVSVLYEYFSSDGTSLVTETAPLAPWVTRTVTVNFVDGLFDAAGSDLVSGYLHVTPQDPVPATPALYGDYFRLDLANDFASGDHLVSSPSGGRGEECQFWDVRFLEGGEFDGGTQFSFYVPENPLDGGTVVEGDVYDLDGNLLQVISLDNQEIAFEVNSSELGLMEPFGVIEWAFRDGLIGNVSGIFKASGRFEVSLRGVCRDAP